AVPDVFKQGFAMDQRERGGAQRPDLATQACMGRNPAQEAVMLGFPVSIGCWMLDDAAGNGHTLGRSRSRYRCKTLFRLLHETGVFVALDRHRPPSVAGCSSGCNRIV